MIDLRAVRIVVTHGLVMLVLVAATTWIMVVLFPMAIGKSLPLQLWGVLFVITYALVMFFHLKRLWPLLWRHGEGKSGGSTITHPPPDGKNSGDT